MRQKPWNQCQRQFCKELTASGVSESDPQKRYCARHMPGGLHQRAVTKMQEGRARTMPCKVQGESRCTSADLARSSSCLTATAICGTAPNLRPAMRSSEVYWLKKQTAIRLRCKGRVVRPKLQDPRIVTLVSQGCTCGDGVRFRQGRPRHLQECSLYEHRSVSYLPRFRATCGICDAQDVPKKTENPSLWLGIFLAAHGNSPTGGAVCHIVKSHGKRLRDGVAHELSCVCGARLSIRLDGKVTRFGFKQFLIEHQDCQAEESMAKPKKEAPVQEKKKVKQPKGVLTPEQHAEWFKEAFPYGSSAWLFALGTYL